MPRIDKPQTLPARTPGSVDTARTQTPASAPATSPVTAPLTGQQGRVVDERSGREALKGLAVTTSSVPVGAQGAQPGSVSPLGARFLMAGLTVAKEAPASPLPPESALDDVRARFDVIADRLRADPAVVGAVREELAEMAPVLDDVVKQLGAQLTEDTVALKKAEEKLGWFERNVGVFSPDDVKDLRGRVETLSDSLDEAKALAGGVRIAQRAGAGQAEEGAPQAWEQRIDEASRAVSAASTKEAGVASLVKLQDRLQGAEDAARLQHAAAGADVDTFKEGVSWHQRLGWVDVVIGGESGRGALYRTGKGLKNEAGNTAADLGAVVEKGEAVVAAHVNELLKSESPEYARKRARYDVLKPAHDQLRDILSSASDAYNALGSAETWIQRRNSLEHQKPRQRYETVNGQQQETTAYRSWSSQYDHASNQARWETHRAESELSSVNAGLPSLQRALQSVDRHSSRLDGVDQDLVSLWGGSFSFGWTSYDAMRVNDAQHDLRDLEGQLQRVLGRVQPEYGEHKSWIGSAMAHRRDELRGG